MHQKLLFRHNALSVFFPRGVGNLIPVFQNCLISHGNPGAPPLVENIDRCIDHKQGLYQLSDSIVDNKDDEDSNC